MTVKKMLAGVLLAITLCCLSIVSIQAAGISRRWSNIQAIMLDMSFSSGEVSAAGIVRGNSDTSEITATFSLREESGSGWTTVHTWPAESASGRSLRFTGSASAEAGETYRLYVTTTVTNDDGNSETVTDYLEDTY